MIKTVHIRLTAATLLLLPATLRAQTTGTSHPEDLHDTIVISSTPAAQTAKPSPEIPVTAGPAPSPAEPVLLERTPSLQSPSSEAQPVPEHYVPAARRLATEETASAAHGQPSFEVTDDPESGVVIDIPSGPNELPLGTLLHTSLSEEISTAVTQRGASFNTKLLLPLMRQGVVLVPAQSTLSGRVAQVHAGNRLHGGPAIQLVPEFVTLPDGTKYRLEAQVIDLPAVNDTRVSDEGVIRGTEHWKRDAAGAGLTTASATAAGALIGGGAGAAVGAAVGVGIATVWYFRHDQEQTLPVNTEIIFRLDRSLAIQPVVP